MFIPTSLINICIVCENRPGLYVLKFLLNFMRIYSNKTSQETIVFAMVVAGSIYTDPVQNLDFTNAIPGDAGGVLRALHTITIALGKDGDPTFNDGNLNSRYINPYYWVIP